MEPVLFVFLLIAFALFIRIVAGSFDGDRVERYVRERGWTLVDKSWDPFGPGWFGEKDARIYQIVYRDERGDLHRAHVKTSMMSGVYLTNDRVVERGEGSEGPSRGDRSGHGNRGSRSDDLAAENERLRARIEELERRASAD